MDTFFQDLKYGVRMLLRSPGFTLVAALSLAIGIGANTTIFTLINAIFLNPIPVEDSATLVGLFTTDERNQQGFNRFAATSKPNFEDYRDGNTTFTGMAAHQGLGLSLASGGEPTQIGGFNQAFRSIAPESITPPPPSRPRGGTETILLVEDEPLVLELAHCALQELGYKVLPCAGADEALRTFTDYPQPIDILVTDVEVRSASSAPAHGSTL